MFRVLSRAGNYGFSDTGLSEMKKRSNVANPAHWIGPTPVTAIGVPADHPDVSACSSVAPPSRDQSRRIVRRQYLESTSLDSTQRYVLVDRLYDVFNETLSGATRDEFEANVFGAGAVRLALFYNARDELAGFAFVGIERLKSAGRTRAVFYAGVCFRVGYHYGASATFFVLRQALCFKLREPRTPLAYCTRSTTPAPYRLIAATMPQVYPNRRYQTPADIETVVREFSVRKRYIDVGERPWVVRSVAKPRTTSRLRHLENDSDVRFYLELNPHFAEGQALMTWVPLDIANIAGGLFRLLRKRIAR